MLMGTTPSDYDIATNAKPSEIMAIFRRTIPVGVNFGVVNVVIEDCRFEVATFRSDGLYSDGRRPDSVNFCDARGDVNRRDFTINGMLFDPVEERLLDYVGGRDDIRAQRIKTIGDPVERFSEDRLRLIRAVRFAARFSYSIEPETANAIKNLAGKIMVVSVERIRDELEKGLTSANPHTFIKILDELNLAHEIIPELSKMKGVDQPENFHPEGDVFVHTLLTVSKLVHPSRELALATLLHDVAKPDTFSREVLPDGTPGRIRFYQHDNLGAAMGGRICKRLRMSTYTRERVMWLIRKHLCIKDVQNMKKSTLKRLFAHPGYLELQELFRVDTLASTKDLTNYEYCRKRAEEMEEDEIKPRPLVNGHDLIAMGINPGPVFSRILSSVMEEQLEDRIISRDEAINFVKNQLGIVE